MATAYTTDEKALITYTGLTTSEAGDSVEVGKYGGIMGCVQVMDGGGSGLNAGTLTMQHSNDGTNWDTLQDLQGDAITYTDGDEDKIHNFSTAAQFIRPLNDGTVSNADVLIMLRG